MIKLNLKKVNLQIFKEKWIKIKYLQLLKNIMIIEKNNKLTWLFLLHIMIKLKKY
jgi:hypothetical protein